MADKVNITPQTQRPNIVGEAIGTKMPEFDLQSNFETLSESDKYHVKKINRINKERYEKVQIYRKGGRRVGLSLTGVAIGIFFYTMYAMKQEKFLDEDFNKIPDSLKQS